MARRCPYLRLEGNRDQVLVEPGLGHRCYVRYQPERVGVVHQAVTCLTPDHRRCPRWLAAHGQGERLGERVSPPRPVAPSTPARRRPTFTEVAALCLGVSVLLALFFVGYAVFYRLQVGPGMRAVPLVAENLAPTAAEVPQTDIPSPSAAALTPLPTAGALVAPVNSPTPLPEPPVPTPTLYVRMPATSPPTRLVIPRIELDIPVLPVGIKTVREGGQPKVVWADVPNAGGFHQTSAYPGTGGNTVINGHRDIGLAVFRHLDRVEVGDEIFLYVGDTVYPYLVVETLVVPEAFASPEQRAENLRFIGAMPEERLTLVTCTPVGLATHRLLVIARPAEQLVPQMPEAGSETGP